MWVLLCVLLIACAGEPQAQQIDASPAPCVIRRQRIVSALDRPVAVVSAGDERLFVVEQAGRVRVLEGGSELAGDYINLSARVHVGAEAGLLSLVFHPGYQQNGRFFVLYAEASSGDLLIQEYAASESRGEALTTPVATLLRSPWGGSHYGGDLHFGPDGLLYASLGDGGDKARAREADSAFGKLVRIEVDQASVEYWGKGLRSPWRFSFDRMTHDLYMSDVGERDEEELTMLAADALLGSGPDFGWPEFEGTHCERVEGCDVGEALMPSYSYQSDDAAIVGGYVYRGQELACLHGHYVFADWVRGSVRSLRWEQGQTQDVREWPSLSGGSLVSFGEDREGELYLVDRDGSIDRLVLDR